MLRRVLPNIEEPWRILPTAGLALVGLALGCGALAQQPPTADIDALAREAAEFTRGRRLGAAWLWGSLLIASVIIAWVRGRARKAARAAAKREREAP
ncbi:MAG TPA: hypothetical protein VGB13_09510 [Candidatus Krumholzibacteria bacterium]|jgi:hypothetical protein